MSMTRIPALDGLRAIAIVMVLTFHAWGDQFRGGFIGVDVFFVLSGFLITNLFITEIQRTGTINLPYFFMRRALRLMPCLWLVVATMLTFARRVDPPKFFDFDLADGAAALTFVTNWHSIIDGGRRNLFGHTWSLAIEEQFYVIWAISAYGLLRSLSLRTVTVCLVIAIFCIDLWRAYLSLGGASYMRLYAGFDVRADELLGGCALATSSAVPEVAGLLRGMTRLVPLGLIALAALCSMAMLNFGDFGLVYVYGPLVTLLTAGVLIDILLNEGGLAARLLSWSPLVYVGSISYGLYLWHDPLMYYVKQPLSPWYVRGIVAFVIAPTLATLSYRYVESPLLRLGRRYQAKPSAITAEEQRAFVPPLGVPP